jgi:hypothetical protein
MSAHTPGSRAAAGLTTLLGAIQIWWAGGLEGHASATAAILGPLSLLAAVALARANILETRLGVVIAVAGQLGLTALTLTIGLPGQPRHDVDGRGLLGLLLPIAVLVAIDLDQRRRTRRSRSDGSEDGSPYAR